MNKTLFAYSNEFETPRFWNNFNWDLYIRVIKAKMKQDCINKEFEILKAKKNETK